MTEWMTMDTAPKDGTWIDAWRPPATKGWCQCRVTVRWCTFDNGESAWVWPDDDYDALSDPDAADEMILNGDCYEDAVSFTHWMPLPSVPAP